MTRKFHIITVMLALLGALAWSLPAAAETVTVSGWLTGDDYCILYYGDTSGSVTYLTSGSRWEEASAMPQTEIPVGNYLYVVAWNDTNNGTGDLNPQAWLGEFNIGGKTVYSDLNTWQYTYTATDHPTNYATDANDKIPPGTVPTGLSALITGSWNTAASTVANTAQNSDATNMWYTKNQPAGPIAHINGDANWIWFDTFNPSSASFNGYAVYRYQVSAVPLPPSALLLGSGLLGLGLLGWRRQRG
jgi:hypothetical protein